MNKKKIFEYLDELSLKQPVSYSNICDFFCIPEEDARNLFNEWIENH